MISTINEYAFEKSVFPVILSLEVHTGEAQQRAMAQIMKDVFKEKLVCFVDAEKTELGSREFSPVGLQRRILVKTKKDIPCPDPSSLQYYSFIQAKKFASIEAAEKMPHYAVVSISESNFERWGQQANIFGRLTKTMIVRTYPAGTRIDSRNYSPIPAWNFGAQIVALNYQTNDIPFRINRAKFAVNGKCGYVLKPKCLRMPSVDPQSYGDRKKLIVEVVLGVPLPKPQSSKKSSENIDPYVQLYVSGIDGDTSELLETSVRENNGFNPRWNERFEFNINSVEMAILSIIVKDKGPMSHQVIGTNHIALSGLRMGYRAVPLLKEEATYQLHPPPTILLCNFQIVSKVGISEDDI